MPPKRNTPPNKTAQNLQSEAVLEALRSNMNILRELSARYEVDRQPDLPPSQHLINTPQDVFTLLGTEMSNLVQEQLRVLLLNIRNQVIGQRLIYQGNVNSSIIRPAEVIRPAVVDAAPKMIIVHNHPSHDPTPSPEDIDITDKLVQAANLMGIELLDHVIIAGDTFLSMKQKGFIPE